MNPARSFGPALISGDLRYLWIYVAGPLAGCLLALALAWALRGRPSAAARTAAEGTAESPDPVTNPGGLHRGRPLSRAEADHEGGRRAATLARRRTGQYPTSRRYRTCCTTPRGPGRCGPGGRSTWTCCRLATRAARPGRTSRRGWPTSRPGGRSRRGSWWRTTRCPPSTAGSATTRARTVCNRAQLDSSVSIHARRAVPRRPGPGAGLGLRCPAAAHRPAGAGRRGRAERAVRRVPPGPARPPGGDPGRQPRAGRDDALRHPRLPAAPRGASRRRSAGSRTSA